MKNLKDILAGVEILNISGDINKQVSTVAYDSRKSCDDSIFVALVGTSTDGHKYINTAINNGATVIIYSDSNFINFSDNSDNSENSDKISYILTSNTRKALARISHNWYDNPTSKMKVIGITGTNGKTTTTFLLRSILGARTGIIGTTGIYYSNRNNQEIRIKATHTTPESWELAAHLAEMQEAGVEFVAMEVSSHALHQNRVDYIDFSVAALTNLTHEHLDYHKSMKEYAAAKKILFDKLNKNSLAIVFDTSEFSDYFLYECNSENKFLIGFSDDSEIKISNSKSNIHGCSYELNINSSIKINLKTELLGDFNIENSALAASIAYFMGVSPEDIISRLAHATGAPGRMQRYLLKNGAVAVVDYAHTPDALEKALLSCRKLLEASGSGKLICLFGCGGDRDKTKRPVMGKISSELADYSIITSDNPRTEDQDLIIQDIISGIENSKLEKIIKIPDRKEAIYHAASISKKGDLILSAGKGHEDYQIIGLEKIHLDDREIFSQI